MRSSRAGALISVALAVASALATGGCSGSRQPVTSSREALGTVVTITCYGSDEAALRAAQDAAFDGMILLEAALDPYDASSTVAAFNAFPYAWHALPDAAETIIDRVRRLGVRAQFSPTLFGVTKLYDFGGRGSVPASATVEPAANAAMAAATGLDVQGSPGSLRARFASETATPPAGAPWAPGLDFGGAAKGLAIDHAMQVLRRAPGVTGAMISAGSSTMAWGRKSDGEPWRIGIEDPRRTGTVVAVIGAVSPDSLNVSTSGDYQQYFERGGIRYHHILDPATGLPARGTRSVTVYGDMTGLDADVLSTALFVMGPTAAKDWVQRHGLGLYGVDDRGRVFAVSAPRRAAVTFERTATPRR